MLWAATVWTPASSLSPLWRYAVCTHHLYFPFLEPMGFIICVGTVFLFFLMMALLGLKFLIFFSIWSHLLGLAFGWKGLAVILASTTAVPWRITSFWMSCRWTSSIIYWSSFLDIYSERRQDRVLWLGTASSMSQLPKPMKRILSFMNASFRTSERGNQTESNCIFSQTGGWLAFWPDRSCSTQQASMGCPSMMAWTWLKNSWVFVWLRPWYGFKKCMGLDGKDWKWFLPSAIDQNKMIK